VKSKGEGVGGISIWKREKIRMRETRQEEIKKERIVLD